MVNVFYAVIFVVSVLAIAGFAQSLIFPPVEVEPDELPKPILDELTNYFPNFQTSQAQFIRLRNRYRLNGNWNHRTCRFKFDITPDGELAEVDFKDTTGPTNFQNRTKIAASQIPLRVASVVEPLFSGDRTSFEAGRLYEGMVGAENAYELHFLADDFEYEVKVTETGRLIELEKESLV